jgi:twitching motility protein PilT
MSLVPSLLQAIVQASGEAMVMHAGEKPYVVSPTGQIELASRSLTLEAVAGIVAQLLPPEHQHALDEFDAVQYELPPQAEFPREHFTVVAARGGDDLWAEIRRRQVPDEDHVPEELFASPPVAVAAPQSRQAGERTAQEDLGPLSPEPCLEVEEEQPQLAIEPRLEEPLPELGPPEDDLTLPDASRFWPLNAAISTGPVVEDPRPGPDRGLEARLGAPAQRTVAGPTAPARGLEAGAGAATQGEPRIVSTREPAGAAASTEPPSLGPVDGSAAPPRVTVAAQSAAPRSVPPLAALPEESASLRQEQHPAPSLAEQPVTPLPARSPSPAEPFAAPPLAAVPPWRPAVVPPSEPEAEPRLALPQPAVVLPMARHPVRTESPPPRPDDQLSGLERLLRVAAARGASTLYLSSNERPSVRVDGDIQIVDGEPVLSAGDVISLLLTLMPERSHEALRTGAATEWICDIEGIGRVRCMSFADHTGPGGVFRLMPERVVSADQLGLGREVQALAIEPEGLILIAGPRSSGKRTLIGAMVDLINRTRRDHLITIEREVSIVHPRGSSYVSQREVRGSDDDILAAARAALREDPDVLVIEQVRNGAMMNVALEAASSGHLVIAGFSAHSATAAVDRIIDLYAAEHSRHVQLALADNLRGVVAQVLLHKIGGGRVAAREVLLNTPAVASVIAEGKTSQLPMAIEGGRRHGMMLLADTLVSLVRNGAVDAREAYRYVGDRSGFVALLKRQGVDTSFLERLA